MMADQHGHIPCDLGIIDQYEASQVVIARKRWMAEQTARHRSERRAACEPIAPAYLPGMVAGGIIRVVEALLYPVLMAGPELEKRLRPHVERLDDISNAPLATRALRSAMHWLLEGRGSAPEATEDADRPVSDARAALIAELDLLPDKQTPPSADQEDASATRPSGLREIPAVAPVLPRDRDQGVH